MEFGPDGNLYLLTYGDGFFAINPDAAMERFEYVKGQRAPVAVLSADTDRAARIPLTVDLLQRGLDRRRPGRLDQVRVGLRRRRNRRLHRPQPDATPTRPAGVFVGRADRHRLAAARSASPTRPSRSATRQPDGDRDHAGRAAGRSPSATTSRSRSPSPTRRTARSTAPGRGHVRARPRHARPRRGHGDGLLRRPADRRRRRLARRQRVRRRQRGLHRPRRQQAACRR